MGGEPTFVSIDDMDGDEWNTAALGPEQAAAGRRSARRVCASALRRAACCISVRASGIRASRCRAGRLSCYWRTDGVPLWRDPQLAAPTRPRLWLRPRDGERFAFPRALARRLGLSRRTGHSRLTRIRSTTWKEGQLPVNVDPLRLELEIPGTRAAAREFLSGAWTTDAAMCCRCAAMEHLPMVGIGRAAQWTFRRGRTCI